MTVFETIGMAWVIFTSSLATVGILYLSIVGLKTVTGREHPQEKEAEAPVEVKEMFKVAR